ncbi:MAG TPA: OsmC family protein [Caulobacteraceae bacterium]|jgi:putative redox protein
MIHATQGDAPYRVEITAGGHALTADEPAANGGGGAGPDPFELVLSGLAACTLITLRMYAGRKAWTGFHISGSFRHRVDDGRHLIDRHLQVRGVPDAAGLERLRDIVERTPVTVALKAGFAIATELSEAPAEVR